MLTRPCFSQGAFLGRTWILLTLGSVWARGESHLPLCFRYRIRCGRPAAAGARRRKEHRLQRSDLGSRQFHSLHGVRIPDILVHLLCLSAGSAFSPAGPDWALVSQKSSEDLAPPSLLLNCISFLITQCPHPRWLPG
uniref:Uncharacterized protein n=1 Tax=Cercocebus atys TaxID=9531 RepID=A0A2K5M132_CERAT